MPFQASERFDSRPVLHPIALASLSCSHAQEGYRFRQAIGQDSADMVVAASPGSLHDAEALR
jgi:hypothetical protein